ncbi:glutaredoxin family protein [Vibrio tritonius]|uniref:Glutaredoxin family protein n=1 Tax=Vibrio tritonius TaxID=1435069 RepID=A0ABS7YUJ9_9VIBR|nr:glutaredoxin family protein [Vibrio tritonius]MCA2018682.1 glutaredoxin family protein [Vibrio tritonius]
MVTLTLYGTQGCHLCDDAYDLLVKAGVSQQVNSVDIADDDELSSRYGVTIPVLCYRDAQLSWPFNFNELIQWLQNNGFDYHQ